ncbi:hypothetical protein SPHINGO361_130153 [Sphingomonas sp. EC-HK361]|nr:hypothetical protein SPHINGO361_130153 [Sphingomonas sp. EC-HK361]
MFLRLLLRTRGVFFLVSLQHSSFHYSVLTFYMLRLMGFWALLTLLLMFFATFSGLCFADYFYCLLLM